MAAAASALLAMSPSDDALDEDLSSISTPLSLSDVDVDGKQSHADDADAMQIDHEAAPDDEDDDEDEDGEDEDDNDAASDSNLSEANDTEAETERLYETPENHRQKDVLVDQFNNGRVFEHTPSKLRAAAIAGDQPDHGDEDALSDDGSIASSHPDEDESPTKPPKGADPSSLDDTKSSAEARKRKRSPLADQSDPEEPLRKRTGSVGAPGDDAKDGDEPTLDEDTGVSTNTHSGAHSDAGDAPGHEPDKDEPSPEDDAASHEPLITKKLTRNGSKRRGDAEVADKETVNSETHDDPHDPAADEDGVQTAEEEGVEADQEEDAETAAKNDEEREPHLVAFSREILLTSPHS